MGEAFTSTGEEKVMGLLESVTEDYVKNLGLAQTTEAEEEANFKKDMDDKRIEKAQLEEETFVARTIRKFFYGLETKTARRTTS
jgi:hypothetical protein